MSEINDDLVEQIAIQMHSIHCDDNDLKWAKQPGKYRAQMRRDARDALTALDKLGFAVVKRHALAAKDAEIKALRQKLFPYADATEISGISWDGKYLIGDKDSISFFHKMKNRGEQIDVYKRAYDQNIASKDAEIARLRDLIRWAHDTLWEINPSNYDHDEVCKLNDASVEVILGLAPTLGERHGKSAEWWAAREAAKEPSHA